MTAFLLEDVALVAVDDAAAAAAAAVLLTCQLYHHHRSRTMQNGRFSSFSLVCSCLLIVFYKAVVFLSCCCNFSFSKIVCFPSSSSSRAHSCTSLIDCLLSCSFDLCVLLMFFPATYPASALSPIPVSTSKPTDAQEEVSICVFVLCEEEGWATV